MFGMETIIGLLSGAVGGNAVGAALKNLSLGPIGNTIAGIVGGGAGATILGMLGADPGAAAEAAGAVEAGGGVGNILSGIAGGAVGGGGLMAIIGAVKNMMGGSNA